MKKQLSNLELTYQCEVNYNEPDRYRDILRLSPGKKFISQGAGLSYSAASFCKNVNTINMRKFNRILNYSEEQKLIEVEAGITLKNLYDFLTPRGYYISVQPGWPDLCVGSLIATNVHGKNQYLDGVFSDITKSIDLFHPKYGLISCSKIKNNEIFELTCGGLGLTGIILSAYLKLQKLKGNVVSRRIFPVRNLIESIENITKHRNQHDFVMSWIDMSNLLHNFGRGFVITGNIYQSEKSYSNIKYRKLTPNKIKKFRPKIFNKYSIRILNKLYYFKETYKKIPSDISLFESLYPFHNKGFYFDLYGNKGFIAHQVLIPEDNIFEFIEKYETLVKDNNIPIILSAFKAFKGKQRFLNFNGNGFSMYTDFINNNNSINFIYKLNILATEHGCISNVIRNNYLQAKVVELQYPEYDEFKNRLYDFDPDRQFVSELSKRLKL